jgi:hypothetical protein
MNTGSQPLDLAGFQLREGIRFTFPPTAGTLAPGGFVVVVKSLAAFTLRYGTAGINIAGEFDGNLSNAGERVVLFGPLNEPILDFAYHDGWAPSADGNGHSLVPVGESAPAAGSWTNAASWRGLSKRVRSPSSATIVMATTHCTPRSACKASTSGYRRQLEAISRSSPSTRRSLSTCSSTARTDSWKTICCAGVGHTTLER